MGLLGQLEEVHDLDIINEFLTDLGIMSGALDALIVPLNNPAKVNENLDELHRIFINIQSAAFYLGVDDIASLVTLGLHFVNELKGGAAGRAISAEAIDWLLFVSTQLGTYHDNIENDDQYFAILDPHISQKPATLYA